MNKQKQLASLVFCLLGYSLLYATHNYSGEIIYKKTGPMTVEATIVTYTKASSVNADRDSLEICWGDGVCERIARSNGNGVLLGANLKYNRYTWQHTYAGPDTYVISMTDYNRSAGIINVNAPSSDNVPFHLAATVRLMPDAASSTQSPTFLLPPIDIAYVFQPFIHIPNAFDVDGDSLAYELTVPLAGLGEFVPNYQFPDQIAPSDDNKVVFNPLTGEFNWTTPIVPGEYCIAIAVKSYHNGQLVEIVQRDMIIFVQSFTNHPPAIVLDPEIQSEEIVDVFVGETVEITVTATDPDPGQVLTLSASGGPFEPVFQEKATFDVTGNAGLFHWNIAPEFLRDQPYQVVFKAKDDYLGNGLASSRIVRFRVRQAVGLNPVAVQEPLSVYPNPSAGLFYVEWPDQNDAPALLRLFNNQGQLQFTQTAARDKTAISLDLTAYPAGVYFVEIQSLTGLKKAATIRKTL